MIFVLVRLVPGDAAMVILGEQASEVTLQALRRQLGLDQPLHVSISTSSAASSSRFRPLDDERPVGARRGARRAALRSSLPWQRSGWARSLACCSASWRRCGSNTALDYLGRVFSLVGLSFPAFVSGILLLLVFAIDLGWFPVLSAGGEGPEARLRNLALPALNLGLIMTAYIMRVTRSSMLEVLNEDYIRTARAKGVRIRQVILRHGLRNALIPIITVVGLYFGTLIGNSVLTEIVFNRPGLGKLILAALNTRDYALLQGLMIVFAICIIIVNTLTDLAYGFVDPRVKYK